MFKQALLNYAAMNQVSLLQYNFKTTLQMIAKSKRPVRLVFLDPYAVPEDLARKLEDPDTPSKPSQSASGSSNTQQNTVQSRGVSHPLPNQQPHAHAHQHSRQPDASFNVPQPHVAMSFHSQTFTNFGQRVAACQSHQMAPGEWIMVRDAVGNMCYKHTGTNKISYSWPPH